MNEFKFEEITIQQTQIHLCSYSDFDPSKYTDHLTLPEKKRLNSFKNIQRKREFVATRILRSKAIGMKDIHYDDCGAPYMDSKVFISISHTKNKAGLAINKHYKIGLDLESIRPNIKTIMHKFLSEKEKMHFDTENIVELCKVWSAKETLYKLAGRKKILFKSELLLNRASDNLWNGKIINSDHTISVQLNTFEHENIIITTNTEAIVKREKTTSQMLP